MCLFASASREDSSKKRASTRTEEKIGIGKSIGWNKGPWSCAKVTLYNRHEGTTEKDLPDLPKKRVACDHIMWMPTDM